MRKHLLNLVALFTVCAVALIGIASTVSADPVILHESSLGNDYQGVDDPMPHGADGQWRYMTIAPANIGDPEPGDFWDMIVQDGGSRWEGDGPNGSFIRWFGSGIRDDRNVGGISPVVRWEAPVSGIADIVLNGHMINNMTYTGTGAHGRLRVLDNDFNLLFDETINNNTIFSRDISDVAVSTGDFLYFSLVATGGNHSQAGWYLWDDALAGEDRNPVDGIKITVVPEPSTLALLGLAGLLLLKRRQI